MQHKMRDIEHHYTSRQMKFPIGFIYISAINEIGVNADIDNDIVTAGADMED